MSRHFRLRRDSRTPRHRIFSRALSLLQAVFSRTLERIRNARVSRNTNTAFARTIPACILSLSLSLSLGFLSVFSTDEETDRRGIYASDCQQVINELTSLEAVELQTVVRHFASLRLSRSRENWRALRELLPRFLVPRRVLIRPIERATAGLHIFSRRFILFPLPLPPRS